jgi:hypothetical protein
MRRCFLYEEVLVDFDIADLYPHVRASPVKLLRHSHRRSNLLHQNLVVLACGFYEARFLLDRVAPPGYLLNPLLRAIRFLFPQPYSGKAFQHRRPKPGVFSLPALFASTRIPADAE